MAMTELPIEKAFTLIEPGPVILVTTKDGRKNNIMTISWHMVLDFTPKIALTTGRWNHSFQTMMRTKECVIAVPAYDPMAPIRYRLLLFKSICFSFA